MWRHSRRGVIVGKDLASDLGVREGDRFTVQTGTVTDSVRVSALVDLGVRDVWTAQVLAQVLRLRYPYKVESWQENNAQLVSALNAQPLSTAVIRGVVIASVVQKQREIGILRAMGTTRGQILRVYLLQGAVLGATGSALGLLLAVAMIWLFTNFVRGSDGLPLFVINLPEVTGIQVAVIATACGVLAAITPARRAAAMDPAQAIRI